SVRNGDVASSCYSELLSKYVGMRLRRARGDSEPLAYFLVRTARGDEFDDLDLPFSERRERCPQCVIHTVGSYFHHFRDALTERCISPLCGQNGPAAQEARFVPAQ